MPRVALTLFRGSIALAATLPLAAQSPARLTLTRDLRIDGVEEDLSRIAWVAVARNGTIAFYQLQEANVLFYDASGRRLGSFGRSGAGPGEFRNASRYGWLGDTLTVFDVATRRITFVAADRSLAGSMPFPTAITFPAGVSPAPTPSRVSPYALLADGTVLAELTLAEDSPSPPWPGYREPRDVSLVRTTRDGTFRDMVSMIPSGPECTASSSMPRGGFMVARVPFCHGVVKDYAADGSRVATVESEQEGEADAYRVTVVGSRGDTAFSRSYRYERHAIRRQVIDSVIVAHGRGNSEMTALMRSIQFPSVYPPIRRVLLGRDDTTWLEEYRLPGSEHRWLVLDARGAVVGELTVASGVHLHVASRQTIWVTEEDQDGLQSVVRYRVGGFR